MLRVLASLERVSSFGLLCLLLLSVAFAGTAAAQKDCTRLLEELKAAQTRWQEAETAWRTAADPMANAQRRIDDINSRLSKITGDLTRAEVDLEKANSDARDCASSGAMAPLLDCSKVPARQQAAQKKVDELTAERDSLLKELKDLESRVEKLEDQNAAAHAAANQAAKDLEAARQAYAKCGEFWVGRITKRWYAENSSQTTKSNPTAGKGQTFTETKRSSSEQVVEVDILPDPPLPGITNPDASVVRRLETYDYYKSVSAGTFQCRTPPPTHWESITNEVTNEKNEKGSAKARVMVYLPRVVTGTYRIEVRVPEITYEINKSSVRTNNDCGRKAPDTVNSLKTTAKLDPTSVEIQGTVNPKTPDVLKGTISDGGDPKRGGEITLTWELRLIKPKK